MTANRYRAPGRALAAAVLLAGLTGAGIALADDTTQAPDSGDHEITNPTLREGPVNPGVPRMPPGAVHPAVPDMQMESPGQPPSKGVIPPPPTGDDNTLPPPDHGAAKTPVIPPPGSPGGNPDVQPK